MNPAAIRRSLVVLLALASAAQAGTRVELRALQRVAFDGTVSDPSPVNEQQRAREEAKRPNARGIEFGVIPTRMMKADTWLNPVTGAVEQRIYPAILHPIPVLRSAHVQTFESAPDLKTIALDMLQKEPGEVEVDPKRPFALVADASGKVVLLSLAEVTIPQDKVDQWRIAGEMTPVELAEHIDDPIADRGRAVLAKSPLPLAGTLVYGTRDDMMRPTTFHALDLAAPDAKPTPIGKEVTEGRVAANGTVVDRVDMRTLRVTNRKGKKVGELTFEDDVAEFNVSPDGKRLAVSTQLRKDEKDEWSPREVATLVVGIDGKREAVVWNYDDAAFLPDGNLLVTAKWAGEGLFVADLKGGKVTRIDLLDAPKDADRAADWWPRTPSVSPDGKRVAYVSGREAYVVGIDGRGWTPVWTTETHEPQSVPTFSPDGRFVAMVVTPLNVMTGPGEVVVFDLQRHVRQPIPNAKGANSDVPIVWRP